MKVFKGVIGYTLLLYELDKAGPYKFMIINLFIILVHTVLKDRVVDNTIFRNGSLQYFNCLCLYFHFIIDD